jgi:hypothetical protein
MWNFLSGPNPWITYILLGVGVALGVPLLIFYYLSRKRKPKRKVRSKKE